MNEAKQQIQQSPTPSPPTVTNSRSPYISYAFMLGSCFLWVSGYLYCNQHNIGPIQLSIVRGIVLTCLCYALCKYKKQPIDLRAIVTKQIMSRNTLFIFHGFAFAFCQFYLPLYIVHTIGNSVVIVVIILDYLIDGKILTKQKLGWLCLGFIGIIIVGNREFLTQLITGVKQEGESSFQNYRDVSPLVTSLVSLLLLGNMCLQGIAIKITQKSTLSPQEINLSFGIMLTCVASVLYFYQPEKTTPQILYPSFLWTGIALGLAQICFVSAIIFSVQVGITMVLANTTILIAYMFSVFRYSEPLSLICVVCSAVTVISLAKVLLN